MVLMPWFTLLSEASTYPHTVKMICLLIMCGVGGKMTVATFAPAGTTKYPKVAAGV